MTEIELDNLRKELDILGKDLVDEIKQALTGNKPHPKVDTGSLVESIKYEIVEDEKKGLRIEVRGNEYFKYVNEGRRPGSPIGIKRILPWVQRKNIVFRDEKGRTLSQKSTAYIIKTAIGRDGIKPYGIRGKELITNNVLASIVSRKEKYIADGLTIDITEYINEEIFKTFNTKK